MQLLFIETVNCFKYNAIERVIFMTVNIKDFGAVGDGKTLNTKAIQAAIDVVGQKGGRVLIEDGIYMTGTVIYRSNVEIHINSDAVLLGSPDCCDYPENDVSHVNSALLPRWRNACLIFAEECRNIALTGMGTIDCNGETFVIHSPENHSGWKCHRDYNRPTPPRAVFFTGCKNVKIEDITMTNQPAGWSYWIHDCDNVTIDKIKIDAEVEYPNNDGIHINASRDVTVSNCSIRCGDDCIVVRANNVSLPENKVCERISVTNCNLTSYSSAIRIGWINDGTIRNCTFSNLVMTDCSCGIDFFLPHIKFSPDNPGSADIGREATLIENMSFSNIIMDKSFTAPINIDVNPHPDVRLEGIQNIFFSDIHCKGPQFIWIQGKEENHIKNVEFNNCGFILTDGNEFEDKNAHGASRHYSDVDYHPLNIKYADNIRFNNTSFTVNK